MAPGATLERMPPMRVISKTRLRQFWENEPQSEASLQAWYQTARHSHWENFGDVREVYAHADKVGDFTVFNICGNKFRLIVDIHFNTSKIFIQLCFDAQRLRCRQVEERLSDILPRPRDGLRGLDKKG